MKKFRIAIVEDIEKNAKYMMELLQQYTFQNNISIEVFHFGDGESFLDSKQEYDLVFMDIELPLMDGVTCAKTLREKDKKVMIVFVTVLAQLAIRGYEVNAFDFIIKPIIKSDFDFKLTRIFNSLSSTKKDDAIIKIDTKAETKMIPISDIIYIEINNHNLIYHLTDCDIEKRGTLSEVLPTFTECDFIKCNRCYLVNPDHILGIKGYNLYLTKGCILISRPQKQSFMHDFNKYLSRKGQ